MDTYPWAASPQQHEWPPLLQLRPEDVGFDGYSLPREGSTSKQVPPSDAEGDPLVSWQHSVSESHGRGVRQRSLDRGNQQNLTVED